MSTTIVETWSGTDLTQLGPIYPFVGMEDLLVIVGVCFWLGFHVIQSGIESREMQEDEEAAQHPERLRRVFEEEARE